MHELPNRARKGDASMTNGDTAVWIVWYEDQFSHDPAFPVALCFSEADGLETIKDSGGRPLEPGWDGHEVNPSTVEQVRALFERSHPDQIRELERRIAENDLRAIRMPI